MSYFVGISDLTGVKQYETSQLTYHGDDNHWADIYEKQLCSFIDDFHLNGDTARYGSIERFWFSRSV